jgi:hypothetical protein
MTTREILDRVHERGVELLVINGKLKATPPGALPLELRAAVLERVAEIKAVIESDGLHAAADADTSLPGSLIAIADAIAAAPRSPFLNDLALSKAAAAFVAAQRAIQSEKPFLRGEINRLTIDPMARAADEIQRMNYRTAYDALEALADKIRKLRAQ